MSDDVHASRKQGCGTNTSNRSSDDKHGRIHGSTTNDGTDLEDEKGRDISPFDIEVDVDFTERRLKGSGGEEIRGTVPANIVKGVEDGGDAGNCCCENGIVECDTERGNRQAKGQ